MAGENMVSMKLTAKEAKDEMEPKAADRPRFPFGLTVHLDEDTLSKLNVADMPDVGMKLLMKANVEVTSVHQSERAGGKKNRHVDLQITDMALFTTEENSPAETKLYGGK